VCLPGPWIEHDDLENPGGEVFADLEEDIPPGVAGGTDLDDQLGNLGTVALRNDPLGSRA
jgi:hypothetical protein